MSRLGSLRGGRIGFSALAQFDTRPQGGNADGVVDSRDAVYRFLVLWTDLNHNGTSEAAELQPLHEAGVVGISLKYKEWKRTDAFGNQFRYRSQFRTERQGLGKDHWVYDVVLVR